MTQRPARLHFESSGLQFEELRSLQTDLARVLDLASTSLDHFYDRERGGFRRRGLNGDERPNAQPIGVSSTATCVEFLSMAGLLAEEPWNERVAPMRNALISAESGESTLEAGNAYTTSFILLGLKRLQAGASEKASRIAVEGVGRLEEMLVTRGAAQIAPYSSSAFVTERALAALDSWDALTDDVADAVSAWAWDRLHEESVLVSSGSPDRDVVELAYAALCAVRAGGDLENIPPPRRHVLRYALDQFFDAQDPVTGLWPRSRPQFVYEGIGNVHCFEYELLTSMLADRRLWPIVFSRLPQLRKAALHLDEARFPAGADGVGWASDHQGRSNSAESWATASVCHFSLELSRLVAEALRRHAFAFVDAKYDEPVERNGGSEDAFADLMDAPVHVDGGAQSLKQIVVDCFVEPLRRSSAHMLNGKPIPEEVPASAILFGPPGTAKTQLAHMVAKALGWPLMKLDPSHLMRKGRAALHAEANTIFQMLMGCDEIVVLLDEFDELVRDRELPNEMESRFLTTAMLPKLAALSDRRRIVYLLATNHLEQFDVAVRRPGRFDMIIPVMPPSLEEKCGRWDVLRVSLERLEGQSSDEEVASAKTLLGDLTFAEARGLVGQLQNGADLREALGRLRSAATLSQALPERNGETWKDRIASQADRIRLPAVAPV